MSLKIPDHKVGGVDGMHRPWYQMKKRGLPEFPHQPDGNQKRTVKNTNGIFPYVEVPEMNRKTYEVAREMAMWTADFVRLEAAERHTEIIGRVRELHEWCLKALTAIQEGNTKAIAEVEKRIPETKAFKEIIAQLNAYKTAISGLKQQQVLHAERIAALEKLHRAKL